LDRASDAPAAIGMSEPQRAAEQNTKEQNAKEQNSLDQNTQDGIKHEDEVTKPLADLRVQVNVPHNTRARDYFTAYPYPTRLPAVKKLPDKLPTKDKSIKRLLEQSGYTLRANPDDPFPVGGWRWQYAYQAALRRKGGYVPHTIMELYPWVHSMLPLIRPEIERFNNLEIERQYRYKKLAEQFGENGIDAENEAVRQGLYPKQVRFTRLVRGHTLDGGLKLAGGPWYITGTHKVPGLTYYWQLPVSMAPGES